MAEERFSRKFETKEQLKEADTDYLRKRGVKRVGHREVFMVEEKEKGIQICGGSATRFYFDDKEPQELPATHACVLFPKEFLPQLKVMIQKTLGNKPKWVSSKEEKE